MDPSLGVRGIVGPAARLCGGGRYRGWCGHGHRCLPHARRHRLQEIFRPGTKGAAPREGCARPHEDRRRRNDARRQQGSDQGACVRSKHRDRNRIAYAKDNPHQGNRVDRRQPASRQRDCYRNHPADRKAGRHRMSPPHQRSEIMNKPAMHFRATMIALAVAGMAAGQTEGAIQDSTTTTATSTATPTTLTSPGQVRVANKFAAPFTTMAGSTENAVALATALRTGTPVTLTYTTTVDGVTTTTTTTFTPPTKPMGWGNVSHSLALAQYSLNQQGITNPTGAQLQAALT